MRCKFPCHLWKVHSKQTAGSYRGSLSDSSSTPPGRSNRRASVTRSPMAAGGHSWMTNCRATRSCMCQQRAIVLIRIPTMLHMTSMSSSARHSEARKQHDRRSSRSCDALLLSCRSPGCCPAGLWPHPAHARSVSWACLLPAAAAVHAACVGKASFHQARSPSEAGVGRRQHAYSSCHSKSSHTCTNEYPEKVSNVSNARRSRSSATARK